MPQRIEYLYVKMLQRKSVRGLAFRGRIPAVVYKMAYAAGVAAC